MSTSTWYALRTEFDALEQENKRLRAAFDGLFRETVRIEGQMPKSDPLKQRLSELHETYRLDRFKLSDGA